MIRCLAQMIILTALIATIASRSALADPCLFMAPESILVHQSDEFALDACISGDISNLMGYSITIRFDPSFLQAMGVEEGSLPMGSGYETFFCWLSLGGAADSVVVNGAILGGTVAGPGALIRLRLKAATVGITYVEIVRSDLRDGDNTNIPHARKRSKVVIEPLISTESSSWGAIKSMFK